MNAGVEEVVWELKGGEVLQRVNLEMFWGSLKKVPRNVGGVERPHFSVASLWLAFECCGW